MVTLDQVLCALKPHVDRVLTTAQAALPERQFQAFRKITLDALGKSGFEGELRKLYAQADGKARKGQE